MQDKALRETLEAAEQRLKALDVEDQDAEREQLALIEYILQKLNSEHSDKEEAIPTQPANGAPTQVGNGLPAGAPEAHESQETAEQKPVAMLGPP